MKYSVFRKEGSEYVAFPPKSILQYEEWSLRVIGGYFGLKPSGIDQG